MMALRARPVVLTARDMRLLASIASASGLAAFYGVSRRRVYQWMDDPDFPEPLDMPWSVAKHWHIEDVEAWRRRNDKS